MKQTKEEITQMIYKRLFEGYKKAHNDAMKAAYNTILYGENVSYPKGDPRTITINNLSGIVQHKSFIHGQIIDTPTFSPYFKEIMDGKKDIFNNQ